MVLSRRAGTVFVRMTLLSFVFLLISGGCLWGETLESGDVLPFPEASGSLPSSSGKTCGRIVSLAPSITEVLYAVGLGKNVVGVTRYCHYPAEATLKTKVGGYFDLDYETILALKPDLVILLTEHQEARVHLSNLGIDVLAVDHKTIPSILESITTIGRRCGAEDRAAQIRVSIQDRIRRIREKTENLPRPGVMVSVGRNVGNGLNNVYIAGKNSFYEGMIEIAGGENVYRGKSPFPVVSLEGIMSMNPEVIVDIIPDMDEKGWDEKQILHEWGSLSHVDAVKHGRVYIFGDDYAVIPGPRFILFLEKMARAIHPEIEW